MTAACRAMTSCVCAAAIVGGISACGSDAPPRPPGTATGSRPATVASHRPNGPADGRPSAGSSRLVGRSAAASRARAAHGPALLAPPLVVGSVADGGTDTGPELDLRMRLRFGRRIPIGHNTTGLDRGGHLGRTRGRVVLAGLRPASDAPLHRLSEFDVGDDYGFTPNGRSPLAGWCYGTEVLLPLRGVPEARSLAALPSGVPRTVRVAVTAKGGGTTTYDVPIYNDRDRRMSRAARATGCDAPYVSGP